MMPRSSTDLPTEGALNAVDSASLLAACKADVWRLVQHMPGPDMAGALSAQVAADADWHVVHPIEVLRGPRAVVEGFYGPLQASWAGLERRTDLFFAGFWQSPPEGEVGHSPPEVRGEGWWATAMGHYIGTFRQPWLGIPATGEPAVLRFGEFYRWQPAADGRSGQVTEARVLLDIVDLARQAGRPLLPASRGLDWLVPGPAAHDGLLLEASDPARGALSMQRTLAMFRGLFDFDGVNLASMGMERFWHPQMMWYGPCGIGTTRGVDGFQRHHQKPFLHAFPDRKGVGHRTRLAEGPYVASTGWPSVSATHAGDYLGVPASGRRVAMRVADWWRCDGRWLTENWVLIDLPHLLLQMDVDLLAALRD
jgi:predicted ester cyclase